MEVIPHPHGEIDNPLKALVFDCRYDVFKGVVVFVRVVEGKIEPGTQLKMMHSGKTYKIEELGVFKNLQYVKADSLTCGEVGYFTANMRDPREIIIGDTITIKKAALEISAGTSTGLPFISTPPLINTFRPSIFTAAPKYSSILSV